MGGSPSRAATPAVHKCQALTKKGVQCQRVIKQSKDGTVEPKLSDCVGWCFQHKLQEIKQLVNSRTNKKWFASFPDDHGRLDIQVRHPEGRGMYLKVALDWPRQYGTWEQYLVALDAASRNAHISESDRKKAARQLADVTAIDTEVRNKGAVPSATTDRTNLREYILQLDAKREASTDKAVDFLLYVITHMGDSLELVY